MISEKDGLQLLDTFLQRLCEAVSLEDNERSHRFRNQVASVTKKISILLQREGEQFGMNIDIYKSIMLFSKSKPSQFQSMLTEGSFYFQGASSYKTREIVVSISDAGSFVPLKYMEEVIVDSAPTGISLKRKGRGERGPGKKTFFGNRGGEQRSKVLTAKVVELINDFLSEIDNETNKKKIVELSLRKIREEYGIDIIEQDEESKILAALAISSKEYLNGLKIFGGNFKKTQSIIDDVLTSLVSMNISNTDIGKSLNISRKRVSNAKERRIEFNDIVEKENLRCIKVVESISNKKNKNNPTTFFMTGMIHLRNSRVLVTSNLNCHSISTISATKALSRMGRL